MGRATVVDHVYAYLSAGHGVAIHGGTVGLRHVRIVTPSITALYWSRGWRGFVKYAIIQTRSDGLAALAGVNSEVDPDALPRSHPALHNLTVVGPAIPNNGGPASLLLRAGTAVDVRGAVFLSQPAPGAFVLDIDDDATWSRFAAGEVVVEGSVFVGFDPLGSLDADPPTFGYTSGDVEGQYLRAPSQSNHILIDFGTVLVRSAAHTPLPGVEIYSSSFRGVTDSAGLARLYTPPTPRSTLSDPRGAVAAAAKALQQAGGPY